jgi:hypothetical protein
VKSGIESLEATMLFASFVHFALKESSGQVMQVTLVLFALSCMRDKPSLECLVVR